MNQKHKRVIRLAITTLIILLAVLFFWQKFNLLFSSTEQVKEFILSFGALSPLVFIVLIALQVLFAPIPGQLAGFVGGYVFGVFLGTLYSMIGLSIGTYAAFILARKYGRRFVERAVKKDELNRYDKVTSSEYSKFALFLIYLLPALPDDVVSYLAGLTNIKTRTFMVIAIVGRFPGFLVLNIIGAGLGTENLQIYIIILGIAAAISFLIYINRKKIEKILMKS